MKSAEHVEVGFLHWTRQPAGLAGRSYGATFAAQRGMVQLYGVRADAYAWSHIASWERNEFETEPSGESHDR